MTPFLKSIIKEDYFENNISRVLFSIIKIYIEKYNALPSKEALYIDLSNFKGINDNDFNQCKLDIEELEIDEKTNIDWLFDETEKWIQNRAIYLALLESLQICDGKHLKLDKAAIPQILSDAISLSFDSHIGHDFLEDAANRYDYYHDIYHKTPFHIDILNNITKGGISSKSITILMAGPGVGKMHPNYIELDTPNGKKKWGDIKKGDKLFGSDGKETEVLETYHHKNHPIYKIIFDDGTMVEAGRDHLWNVISRKNRKKNKKEWQTLSTEELINIGIKIKDGNKYRKNWEIPIQGKVNFKDQKTNIHPYLVGVWIGNGCRNVPTYSITHNEIADKIKSYGYKLSPINHGYRVLGISKYFNEGVFKEYSYNRYIPD